MPPIRREWCEIAKSVIAEAQERMNARLVNPLFDELPEVSLQELAPEFFKKMRDLAGFANEISIALKGPASHLPDLPLLLVPVFKALFLQARLAKARQLDQQRIKTNNPSVIQALEEKLEVYDGLIREAWFQQAEPEYPLSLGDVLTLERVEQLDAETRSVKRQYDEKFHLLQSPTLFLPDLHYYRSKCHARRLSVAIAFLDIDKFKEVNDEFGGETNVDRHVLPVFMRAVESQVFAHGYAYRFGGDEYALLMPNADESLGVMFVDGLRTRVAALRFHGADRTITVSAGICVADRDCFLTDAELLQKAERAKNFAKREGRNRVAGYAGKLFDESELRVLAPLPLTPRAP